MTSALSLMDISEDLTAFLPSDALQVHTIGAAPVEVPFDQRVSSSLPDDAFSCGIIIGKDIVTQVTPDLIDPCRGGSLSSSYS